MRSSSVRSSTLRALPTSGRLLQSTLADGWSAVHTATTLPTPKPRWLISLRLRVSANTGVARGKIYLAKQKGLPIPEVWAISAAGAPTTDPADAIDGIILPMAQHKGYAIAVIMDMLSGVLTGSGFGTGVRGPYQAEHRSAETAFPAKPIKVIVGFDHVLLPRTLAWQ